MDVVQSAVLHRKGKKWKSRWAVLRKNTAVADPFIATTLSLYKDANHARSNEHKQILPLWRYAGCSTVGKVEKAENVLLIFIENTTIAFAFQTQSLLNQWYDAFQNQFGKETTFPVTIPAKQKLKAGDSSLLIYNDFFSIIHVKSYRCIGRWDTRELCGCATIEGDFLFEVNRTRISKGYPYGKGHSHTFRLKTKHSDDMVQIFDYIKDNYETGATEPLKTQFDTGSGSILDMERDRRNTIDTRDQGFFQRALLRVSNRFRKHKRGRAATIGSQSKTRRGHGKDPSQASSSLGNGSANDFEELARKISRTKIDLPNESGKAISEKTRSDLFGDLSNDLAQRSRAKAQNRSLVGTDSVSSAQSSASRTAVPKRSMSSSAAPLTRGKASAGSLSGMSIGSRGVSTSSDVFDEETNDTKEARKPKHFAPPVAPPRSPISLGIFEFPDIEDGSEAVGESDYLNKDGLDMIMRRQVLSSSESNEVLFRKKADGSSLLDEIDREIKRRTRDEDSNENDPSTPLSMTSFDNQYDVYDNDENEAYVMLRTTDLGPTASLNGDAVDGKSIGRKQSTEVPVLGKESVPVLNDHVVLNGMHKPEGAPCVNVNLDPGVHSPNKLENGDAVYQNVSEIISKPAEGATTTGRRNSSRRSSSKHLSDPLLTERLANLQQQWHTDNVASSLRELAHEETNYVNMQGQNNNDRSSYVNVNAGGASERKLRKKKPSPLNFNFDKYDDDDKIYHDVGPLMGNERSGSSEAVGTYRNVGGSSYENIAGRVPRNRAYVNMPSPSHKKFVPMLNYVLVSGSKGGSTSSGHRTSRSGSLNSVNSDKSQYSYIDEKQTSLLRRTREQHWQRREEDGQAKLKKSKKSQGE